VGDLTYLIIFLVVINIVGRIFRAIQKSAGQQAPGTKPKVQPGAKPKGPFAVLAERLENLGEMEKQPPLEEEPPSRPYVETVPEEFTTEVAPAETPRDFALETTATREADFEQRPRKELHEESFPWQGKKQYEYRSPVSPMTPASGPEQDYARSYRGDVLGMLREPESVRNAVLLGTILGPCRAREGKHRFRGPR
jgi:hypothetical protein